MISTRHDRRGVLLALALALLVVVLLLVSAIPASSLLQPKPVSREPLQLELVEPAATQSSAKAQGMSVDGDGFGTVLDAPARRYEPSPDPPRSEPKSGGPAVAPEVAERIKLFARSIPPPATGELVLTTLEAHPPQFATVILRDGCLRLKQPGEPHAVFAPGTRLYIDDAGYLTIGNPANDPALDARVGELLWWGGGVTRVANEDTASQLRERCGPGAVKLLGFTSSAAASQAEGDGLAAANFDQMYGVGWKAALAYVRQCRERMQRSLGSSARPMVFNICGSTPPSPVANPAACPAGTSLSGGLCRTADGHVRPVPGF